MTTAATLAFVIVRLISAAFFLLTAVYALLVYLPFSYQQFILSNVDPRLVTFVAWHHVLFWGVLAAIAASSLDDVRTARRRARTLLFLGAGILAGVYVTTTPLLPGLTSDRGALVVCLVSIVPVLWLAGLDVVSGRGVIEWSGLDEGEDRRAFDAAIGTAVFVSLVYVAIAATGAGSQAVAASAAPERVRFIPLAWSVTSHLVLFGAGFLALVAIRGLVRIAGGSVFHQALVLFVVAVAAAALVFKQIVFAAISFTGPAATGIALAFALAVVGLWAGVSVRMHLRWPRPVRSGLEILTSPFAFLGASRSGALGRVLSLAAIAGTAWFLSRQTSMIDWDYLLQKMSAIATWAVAFAALYAMRDGISTSVARTTIVWLLLAAAVPAAAYRALDTVQDRVPAWLGLPGVDVHLVLDSYAGTDASFKLIHDAVSGRATADERGFYDLLQRNTNIPREQRVDPVEVDLVDALAPRSGRATHIFIFVIDSLRQDYVSPYNPRVTFTPAIDAFARDSVVFKRAFTRYGATGLSQPSIWVGGLLIHKQYVLPFAPMNTLAKLLAVDGYQRFISRDTITRTIVPEEDTDVDLDAGVQNMDYNLCRSLGSLQEKLLGAARLDRPIFAYTQPQTIHVSRLTREGAGAAGGAAFPGFYAPYAAGIQAMDVCFGAFVQFLRDQGLYDDSVIILTSDHGESLGEEGRWGHAYTMFPEIIRIPLIVHLPKTAAAELTCDADASASLVDITPTLYYLLGHRPVKGGGILGRPLCTSTPQERIATRRDSYMVVSSYGPVYGILRGNGRWLYIADGVNYTDYYYELTGDPPDKAIRVTPTIRGEYQQLIREGLEALNRFYGRKPP